MSDKLAERPSGPEVEGRQRGHGRHNYNETSKQKRQLLQIAGSKQHYQARGYCLGGQPAPPMEDNMDASFHSADGDAELEHEGTDGHSRT